VVLVHGNGPQVGLLALQNSAYDKVTPYPLDILGAESQGMIGYMLQQALKNNLPQRESVLLTQVEVDAADPALLTRPSTSARSTAKNKPVRWQRKKAGCLRPTVTYRRRVPSPQPKRRERCHYRAYPARSPGDLVTAAAGFRWWKTPTATTALKAVIDKDLSAALLARQIEADALLILTDADAVYLDWGKPTQRPLAQVTPELLRHAVRRRLDGAESGRLPRVC
jgi:carbamate kinase